MIQLLANKHVRLWIPPLAGFIVYGSWAFLINSPWLMPHNGSFQHGVMAAITQGGYSFIVTLVLALFVEWLFVRLQALRGRGILVFFLALSLLAFTSYSLNMIAGTPNILWTILPGLMVSSVYTAVHIFTLSKLSKTY